MFVGFESSKYRKWLFQTKCLFIHSTNSKWICHQVSQTGIPQILSVVKFYHPHLGNSYFSSSSNLVLETPIISSMAPSPVPLWHLHGPLLCGKRNMTLILWSQPSEPAGQMIRPRPDGFTLSKIWIWETVPESYCTEWALCLWDYGMLLRCRN